MNVVEVDTEYKNFRRVFMQDISMYDSDKFWMKVQNFQNGDGNPVFEKILQIRNILLLYPHSTASCERIFSAVNQNKTSTRNRMETELLNNILFGKGALKVNKSSCFDYKVTNSLTNKFNISMYSFKNKNMGD